MKIPFDKPTKYLFIFDHEGQLYKQVVHFEEEAKLTSAWDLAKERVEKEVLNNRRPIINFSSREKHLYKSDLETSNLGGLPNATVKLFSCGNSSISIKGNKVFIDNKHESNPEVIGKKLLEIARNNY